MAPRWHFLDNVDGDRADKSLSVTSKWWFLGTRAELFAWLPAYKANANFALLDSMDGTSGTLWAPESSGGATVYQVQNARFTALDRFEYQVYITAIDFSKGGSGGGGSVSFPDRTKLSTEAVSEMTIANFTITEEMAGKQAVFDATQDKMVFKEKFDWAAVSHWPFNELESGLAPDQWVGRTLRLYTVRRVMYLSGNPYSNRATIEAFKGIKSLVGLTGFGRVIQNEARLIYDSQGSEWTEWVRAVQSAPAHWSGVGNCTWNTSWMDF